MRPTTTFAAELKSAPQYLDLAANWNGEEKSFMTRRALGYLLCGLTHVDMLEIGPGGGTSLDSLVTSFHPETEPDLALTLVEMDGVQSDSLDRARARFEGRYGLRSTSMINGDACRLPQLVEESSRDLIVGSALLHEIYSYADRGYSGLHTAMSGIARVLRPDGYFAYRDVLSVSAPSLHGSVLHSYSPEGWTRFMSLYLPHYLDNATHPYHHNDDELMLRQDSQRVHLDELNVYGDVMARGPIGLFREFQRHYITLRDHVWRSGILGFKPVLDGPKCYDWLDTKAGHKRVHYTFTDSGLLSSNEKQLLAALSESDGEEFIIDGDIFDEVTETGMTHFLAAAQQGDTAASVVWGNWVNREGSETYACMTLDQIIGTMAIQSTDVCDGYIMLPVSDGDVVQVPRNYYNRLLGRVLSNPLPDGKQLILFRKISLLNSDLVRSGLEVAQQYCSRDTLAHLYSLVTRPIATDVHRPVAGARQEAETISKINLIRDVSNIRPAGAWSLRTSIIQLMRSRAIEAVTENLVEIQTGDDEELMYAARLVDLDLPTNDNRRGEISLRYDKTGFIGIRYDLRNFSDHQYHLYSDGRITRVVDGKETELNSLTVGLLYRKFRSLRPLFFDPNRDPEFYRRDN